LDERNAEEDKTVHRSLGRQESGIARLAHRFAIRLTSPNAIDPVETFTAFLLSVVVGARRFARIRLLPADLALQDLLGSRVFPVDDTIRNLFKRFGQGQCQRFFGLVELAAGAITGMFSRLQFGFGFNGIRALWSATRCVARIQPAQAWTALASSASGRCWPKRIFLGTARGVVEFLKEALALLPRKYAIRVVRADAGFCDQQLLGFLEQRGLSYVVVARLTRWLKREAARVSQWRALDEHYAAGEFSLQLLGRDGPRRFVVIRGQ
jgi:hypothetical protein